MLTISEQDILDRLKLDNPWWEGRTDANLPPRPRAYLKALLELLREPVRRAVILMGARRVGKTTLLQQLINEVAGTAEFGPILFASVDAPIYADLSLEQLVTLFGKGVPHDPAGRRLIIFDEIQYLRDWERHLKDLVDRFPQTRFMVSGSAGAALKRRSTESGAGRFTDFELPPLTFSEFLDFTSADNPRLAEARAPGEVPTKQALEFLNEAFVDYVNFGGYPEVAINPAVRADMPRLVRNDIVDKVLLRDLPSLYGISNITELNRLFNVVAFNTGQLMSPEGLSQNSGITKPTIERYLEYLEAAFLIVRLRRVDMTAKRLRREYNFKVYLTNPSMRAALFGPVATDDAAMGALAETALVTQYLHWSGFREITFANWRKGEVDVVFVDPASQRPLSALDVKWSDRAQGQANEWAPLIEFAQKNELPAVWMTSRTRSTTTRRSNIDCIARPLALVCDQIGRTFASDIAIMSRFGLPGPFPGA